METRIRSVALGLYLTVVALLLVVTLVLLWPEIDAENNWTSGTLFTVGSGIRTLSLNPSDDVRLILLVAVVGGLGACVHATTSFATFAGNKELELSWSWWYLLRPFIGSALALVFYFSIRGGFLSAGNTASKEVSLYGMMALAGLVGMFSKQATDKLNELFTSLFRTRDGEGDAVRKDKLKTQAPVTAVMIPPEKIQKVTLASSGPSGVSIKELQSKLSPTVTRIPVVEESGKACWVLHESQIYKYIAENLVENPQLDLTNATLADLLADKGIEDMVKAIGFVAETATLGDARKVMDQKSYCRDVFVTENGDSGNPILGWLTDVDLGKKVKS